MRVSGLLGPLERYPTSSRPLVRVGIWGHRSNSRPRFQWHRTPPSFHRGVLRAETIPNGIADRSRSVERSEDTGSPALPQVPRTPLKRCQNTTASDDAPALARRALRSISALWHPSGKHSYQPPFTGVPRCAPTLRLRSRNTPGSRPPRASSIMAPPPQAVCLLGNQSAAARGCSVMLRPPGSPETCHRFGMSYA